MSAPLADTHADVERMRVDGYRRMSAARKLAIVWSLRATALAMARAGLRQQQPDANEDEVLEHLSSLWLPAGLHTAVCAERARRRQRVGA